jgi:glutaminase
MKNSMGAAPVAQLLDKPRRSPIQAYLDRLLAELRSDRSGNLATYIPELATVDPESFGISLATVDGKIYSAGQAGLPFTIQSMSKPFSYGLALNLKGRDAVLQKVGVEPTGEAFNSIILDDIRNRPFNPMVNSGAIAVSDIISSVLPASAEKDVLGLFSGLAGRPLGIDQAVYRSESETGHRNRAIAYMMLNTGMISMDPEEVLDLYFRQCSILVTCEDMANMAATLANHGVNPVTGEEIFSAEIVSDILTLMSTCGMYNYAGQWAFEVGLPAKSGVSGGVMAVIPGQLGISVFSPLLDAHGNSIRGVKVCQRLSKDFSLHAFENRTNIRAVIRREYRADLVPSKRMRSQTEREFLRKAADSIGVVEAQGALFFGSAEILTRKIFQLAESCRFMTLDVRRVSSSDGAAERLLLETLNGLAASGTRISIAGLRPDGPLAGLRKKSAADGRDASIHLFEDADRAIEAAEELLLAEEPQTRRPTKFALANLDILKGLSKSDLRLLEGAVAPMQFAPGDKIIQSGDEARLFFVVAKGSASIYIPLAGGLARRVGSVGPGFSFGEMALLDGGRRSADVIADEAMVCYGFPVQRIHDISIENPQIYATILGNLVKSLSDRLRLANDEIRALD